MKTTTTPPASIRNAAPAVTPLPTSRQLVAPQNAPRNPVPLSPPVVIAPILNKNGSTVAIQGDRIILRSKSNITTIVKLTATQAGQLARQLKSNGRN